MEEPTARKLRFLTLQVVGAVAAIHLVVALAELGRLAAAGLFVEYFVGGQALVQPEPWLFVLSGGAILAGALGVGLGYLDYRRAYVLGIAMMATYIVGWLAWHTIFDHGMAFGADVGAPDQVADHSHASIPAVIVSHYFEPLVGVFTGADQPGQVTLAVVSKTLELLALGLLAVLLAFDPRVEEPNNPVAAMSEETATEE